MSNNKYPDVFPLLITIDFIVSGQILIILSTYRLRYYSLYITLMTAAVATVAASVHFFVEAKEVNGESCEDVESKQIIGINC